MHVCAASPWKFSQAPVQPSKLSAAPVQQGDEQRGHERDAARDADALPLADLQVEEAAHHELPRVHARDGAALACTRSRDSIACHCHLPDMRGGRMLLTAAAQFLPSQLSMGDQGRCATSWHGAEASRCHAACGTPTRGQGCGLRLQPGEGVRHAENLARLLPAAPRPRRCAWQCRRSRLDRRPRSPALCPGPPRHRTPCSTCPQGSPDDGNPADSTAAVALQTSAPCSRTTIGYVGP